MYELTPSGDVIRRPRAAALSTGASVGGFAVGGQGVGRARRSALGA